MAETCAMVVKQEEMRHPNLAQAEFSLDDDQGLAPHRTKAEPLSSLCFMSTTSRDIDVKPSSSMNTEDSSFPSESPTLVSDVPAQILKESRTPTPLPTESLPGNGSVSKSSTPPLAPFAKPRKAVSAPPQLIGGLPVARGEAFASFTEIQDNNYQNKTLGRSRELLESMTCECAYEPGSSSISFVSTLSCS
jgi:histone-lysine N-methyltransferase SETD2